MFVALLYWLSSDICRGATGMMRVEVGGSVDESEKRRVEEAGGAGTVFHCSVCFVSLAWVDEDFFTSACGNGK